MEKPVLFINFIKCYTETPILHEGGDPILLF